MSKQEGYDLDERRQRLATEAARKLACIRMQTRMRTLRYQKYMQEFANDSDGHERVR